MLTFSNLGNYGHLGNQMFQYASLRGIADNRGFEWAIPPEDKFGSHYQLRSRLHECFELVSAKRLDVDNNPPVLERQFHFDEELFNTCPDNVDLIGYFQSYKYFDGIKESIKKDFSFKQEISNRAAEFLSGMNLSKTVSLHIRRTDYVSNSAYHTNIPAQYYLNVINNIGNIDEVVVFSDDIDWCRNIFDGDRFVFSNESAYVDLCAMSMCRTNIIANSSFSWWAAWLNNWQNKLVFCPSAWFGPANSHLNTKDLVPKDWIKL